MPSAFSPVSRTWRIADWMFAACEGRAPLSPLPRFGETDRMDGSERIEPADLLLESGFAEREVTGSELRKYLRRRYPDHPKGESWLLTPEQADEARRSFSVVSSGRPTPRDQHATRAEAYAVVDEAAAWSEWVTFSEGSLLAPKDPGVYMMRLRAGGIVYVGMAGERRGQGIHGRLSIYRRGKGAVSGFGEAALDRALADPAFIEKHLEAVRAGSPVRASVWARDAIEWLDVEVRWVTSEDMVTALSLETAIVEKLSPHGLWNRVAVRSVAD